MLQCRLYISPLMLCGFKMAISPVALFAYGPQRSLCRRPSLIMRNTSLTTFKALPINRRGRSLARYYKGRYRGNKVGCAFSLPPHTVKIAFRFNKGNPFSELGSPCPFSPSASLQFRRVRRDRVSGGGPCPIGWPFSRKRDNMAIFTEKMALRITCEFKKANPVAKLDCNSEGFAPIGFGGHKPYRGVVFSVTQQ